MKLRSNIEKYRRYGWRGLLFTVCAVLFLFSAGLLISEQVHTAQQEVALNNLRPNTAQSTISSELPQEPGALPSVLPQYRELLEQNSDLAGWIRIDGTGIDYPVMYTGDDFYLEHDFNRKPSPHGVPYIDKRCTIDPLGTNTILYAHHMKNGSMFARLLRYKDPAFYQQHPVIRFDTLYREQEYDILAVFESKVYRKNEDVFKHYNFLQAESEQQFNEYLAGIQALSLYDTGVTAAYGDTFITLMTCAYHTENGRFVVVAKQRNAEEASPAI